jgi:hypothetical protein
VDTASLILIATGLLALLGAAAANLGSDSRDGFGVDHLPRDFAPRIR